MVEFQYRQPNLRFPHAVRASSYVGVNLFFALSGFLITGILLDTLHISHFFKTFYARRVLRIFPLYYGVLLLMLLFTRPLHLLWNGWQYFFLTYTSNLVLWSRPPLILPHFNINHFWSLQVEEQFYLIWPLIIYRVRKLQSLIRISVITCVIVLLIRVGLVAARPYFHNIYLTSTPTFSCVDNLLFGCCLCFLLRTSMRHKVFALAPRVLAGCAVVLLCAAILNHGLIWETSIFIPTLGFSLIGIASASIIAMTLRAGSHTEHFFNNGVLRFFGKYSYGLYVFHYTLDLILTGPIRDFIDARFHSKALGVLVGAIVVTLASIAVALLSYRFYESRFLHLKKYFSYSKPDVLANR
ncbi:acyltransferase [Edaphobacter paludis]|uniref:Acyltransferase n=1 Tax=Edaphobacter paludis TaxID=3035702 RepID=A0AAU7DCD0_9BACT